MEKGGREVKGDEEMRRRKEKETEKREREGRKKARRG